MHPPPETKGVVQGREDARTRVQLSTGDTDSLIYTVYLP